MNVRLAHAEDKML